MTRVDGHAHAGAADAQVGDRQDLAALEAQLLLFVGFERTIVYVLASKRQHVERNGLGELGWRWHFDRIAVIGEVAGTIGHLPSLLIEFVDTGKTAAADGLIGADNEAHKAGLVVQRLEHGHRRHRGAVGVGDDALVSVRDFAGIDLADNERDLGVHAPRRRVVDDHHTSGSEARCEHA